MPEAIEECDFCKSFMPDPRETYGLHDKDGSYMSDVGIPGICKQTDNRHFGSDNCDCDKFEPKE